jgi:hypothetical protein
LIPPGHLFSERPLPSFFHQAYVVKRKRRKKDRERGELFGVILKDSRDNTQGNQ